MLYDLGYNSFKINKNSECIRHTFLTQTLCICVVCICLQNVDVDRDPEEALETVPDHI